MVGTFTPSASQSCSKMIPSPLAAEQTSTMAPGSSLVWCTSAVCALTPPLRLAALSAWLTEDGFLTRQYSGTVQYSAQPGHSESSDRIPATSSPGVNNFTILPTVSVNNNNKKKTVKPQYSGHSITSVCLVHVPSDSHLYKAATCLLQPLNLGPQVTVLVRFYCTYCKGEVWGVGGGWKVGMGKGYGSGVGA